MAVQVTIEKRHVAIISLLTIALFGSAAVYGYVKQSSFNSPNPGHPVNEIGGYFSGNTTLDQSFGMMCQKDGTNCQKPPICATGQVLTYTATGWACVSAGGGSVNIVGGGPKYPAWSCGGSWGGAYCTGPNGFQTLFCPAGSNEYATGEIIDCGGAEGVPQCNHNGYYMICIRP